jgi:diguanylate cyclase (GGDEF)-like protein
VSSHPTGAALNLDQRRGSRVREFARLRPVWTISFVFASLLAVQALGFFLLGTGRAGMGLSESILVVDNLLGLVCAWTAFRRAQGLTALFWFLFCVVAFVLLVPTAIQAYDTIFHATILSDSNRTLLYCLYGAPILMMLFLPEAHQTGRVKSEVMLDLFQVAIVVSLIYSTFFFLPVRGMLPAAATLRSINVSDLQSLLLLVAGFVRLQFARIPTTRNLLLRLTLFLMVCAIATFSGDWIDVHYHSSAAWFDLGWAVPVIVEALLALTWPPAPEPQFQPERANFLSFLGTNLVLVAMLSGLALLTDRWRQAYGGVLTNVAIATSLLALTLRLALTQFHQYQEISHRRAAQSQLAASHEKIAGLLDYARRQTAEITQINELGTVLQACVSREEAFRVIPERLERLLPGASGTLSILNPARTRAEVVAEWGVPRPKSNQPETNDELASRREHSSEPGSISIPLIARDEAIGVLLFQDQGKSSAALLSHSKERARVRQLASALAEHIALTISNLDLRAALQTQAIRDPLTGLYNRRYMQEALERELHRARRRERPLSVMMLDIDHFKRYNDTFGHAAGDDALRLVAETLMSSIRAEDLACRYGGEEFVVILPECALPQAALRAEEVRTRLRELYVERPGELPEVVTVSIGVAGFQETTGKIDLLLKFADDALYQAKHEGRDRVVVSRPELSDPHRSPRSQPKDGPDAVTAEPSIRS